MIKINFITGSIHSLENYFAHIDNIRIYCNTDYKNNIITNISIHHKKYITDCISKASIILQNLDRRLHNKNSLLNDNVWNICIYNNMMFNLPFTLDDIIFLPTCTIDDYSTNVFIKTLIHERLHVLQRYNTDIWHNYIINNTNWLYTDDKIVFNVSILKEHVLNPDTFYVVNKYLYCKNNKYYYCILVHDNNIVKNFWFECIKMNNIYYAYPTSFTYKYEHPYEELAYILSEQLISNL